MILQKHKTLFGDYILHKNVVTFASGNKRSHVNYWEFHHSELENVSDLKDIRGESCLSEHRTLLLKLHIPSEHRQRHATVISKKNQMVKAKRCDKALLPLGKTPQMSGDACSKKYTSSTRSRSGLTSSLVVEQHGTERGKGKRGKVHALAKKNKQ